MKRLTFGKSIKSNSKISSYSPFLVRLISFGPFGNIRRLIDTKFDTKEPILLDARYTLFRLLAPLFSSISKDYFGPYYVPIRSSTEKRWVFFSLAAPPGLYISSLCRHYTPAHVNRHRAFQCTALRFARRGNL